MSHQQPTNSYHFDARIRYSETDSEGILTMEGLLNYFQDCSTFQSEDGGVGIKPLKDLQQAWVINSWQIEIAEFPRLCDEVTVGTVPYGLTGFIGNRNFYMQRVSDGKMLAVANSVWSLFDMVKMLPARIPDEMRAAYPLGEKLPMEYLPRKLRFQEGGEGIRFATGRPITVHEHHLDTNHHVNNAQYIRMAISCLQENGFLTQVEKISRCRADYRQQAHLDDVLTPQIAVLEDDTCMVSLNAADGSAVCIVELQTRQENYV